MTAAANEPAQYAVGAVRAVRAVRLGADGRLYPLYDDRPGTPGRNDATCWRGRAHLAPASNCRCGFYAYGHLRWIRAQPPSRSVLAVVALWGRSRSRVAGCARPMPSSSAYGCTRASTSASPRARQRPNWGMPLYRSRGELLERHPLTALEGYEAAVAAGGQPGSSSRRPARWPALCCWLARRR